MVAFVNRVLKTVLQSMHAHKCTNETWLRNTDYTEALSLQVMPNRFWKGVPRQLKSCYSLSRTSLLSQDFDYKTSWLGKNLCPLYRECLLYSVSVLERFHCIKKEQSQIIKILKDIPESSYVILLWLGFKVVTVEPLYSGHHWFLEMVSAIEECLL